MAPRSRSCLALCLLTLVGTALGHDHTTETMGDISFSCLKGWMVMAPDCYLLIDYEMTHKDASEMCEKYGASLAEIADEVEAKALGQLVQQNYNQWERYWIGNEVEDEDDVCSAPWVQGEPGEVSSRLYVAADAPQGRWSPSNPDRKLPAVCKTPAAVQNTFRCMDGSKFISGNFTCDGEYDCDDQSDEDNCESLCTRYLYGESGTLQEDSSYTAGETCTWFIEGQPGKPLSVLFSTIDLEDDVDRVEVWGGGPTFQTSVLLATLTGQTSNQRVLSNNHFLIISLIADLTNHRAGFVATWESDAELSPTVRDVVVTDAGAEITSPYYGTQQDVNTFLRQYRISSDDGAFITMKVLENDLTPGLQYDPMTLSFVNDFDIIPDFYVSVSDKFSLSIKSDGPVTGGSGGFKAVLAKGCAVDFSRASGILVPPNYDSNSQYPALLNCTYIVRAPENETRGFLLRFPVFELGDSRDYVKIYNGADSSSPELSPSGGFTVDNPASDELTAGPVFSIHFYSSYAQNQGIFFISFYQDCPAISNTGNRTLTTTETKFETAVDISCQTGHAFVQEEFQGQDVVTVTCGEQGKWDRERLPTCQEVYCGVPEPINNGFISDGDGATYQDTVTYQCFEGFTMNDSSVITCGANGTWSARPTCSASVCPPADNPEHGSSNIEEGAGQDFGTILKYSCDPGYELVGSQYSLCESNGTWSHDLPECRAIKCPLPEVSRGSLSSSDPVVFNTTLTVTCDTGFIIADTEDTSADYACLTSGSFDLPTPVCQDLNECQTGDVCSGLNEECENTVGSYSCDCEDGYRNESTICEKINFCAEGKDSCDSEHGLCTPCMESPCDYSCDCQVGYTLFTSNGTEEKFIPSPEDGTRPGDVYHINHTCVPKTCQRPEETSHLTILSSKSLFFYTDTVEFQCEFGYTLNGSNSSTCGSDKQWIAALPTCDPLYCDALEVSGPLFLNAYPSGQTSPGEMVLLECESEMGPAYNKTLFCAYDRESDTFRLQGDSPDCPAIDCGPVELGSGENFTRPSDTGLGSTFTFDCITGFELKGASAYWDRTVACLASGRWGFGNLTCEGKRCTDPGTPGGMEQVSASFDVNGVVEYSCTRPGFAPTARFLVCEFDSSSDTAQWNDTLPSCQDVEAPSFTNCPSDAVQLTRYSAADTQVSMPVAEDNSGLVLPLTVTLVDFRLDALLTQPLSVAYIARDSAGNEATCSIQFHVTDPSVPLSLECPDYLILNVTSSTPSTYDLSNDITSDVTDISFSTGSEITVGPDTVGQQVVRVTARSQYGFTRQCAFIVETRPTVCLRAYIEADISSKNATVSCTETPGSGLDCTVTCTANHAFQDGQTSTSYSCSGENLWTPSLPVRSCVELGPPQYQFEVTVQYVLPPGTPYQISQCQSQLTEALRNDIPNRTVVSCITGQDSSEKMTFAFVDVQFADVQVLSMNAHITLAVTSDTSSISVDVFDACESVLNLKPLTGSLFAVEPELCASGINMTSGDQSEAAGSYSCAAGSTVQTVDSNTKCVPCEPGSKFNNSACVPCEDGTYQSLAGQSSCSTCENGASASLTPRLAPSQCVAPCPPGFAVGMDDVCLACPEDQYLNADSQQCSPCGGSQTTAGVEGATSADQCVDKCTVGRYPVNNTGCQDCPTGFYKDTEGSANCLECADNLTTTISPATSASHCVEIADTPSCENGGVVVARRHQNVCDCPPGYYGDTCQHMVNRCDSAPCYNGGTCSPDGPDAYTCSCPSEEHCTMEAQPVPYNSDTSQQLYSEFGVTEASCKAKCLDNSTCYAAIFLSSQGSLCVLYTEENVQQVAASSDSTTFVKSCDRDYFFNGTNCEVDLKNDCTNATCADPAFCRDKVDSADCVCPGSSKYVGERCEQDTDLCKQNPCENGASCIDSGGGVRYTCVCLPGFTGDKCQADIDDCEANPDGCLYGGQCDDGINGYTCQCGDYGGAHCQQLADLCNDTCNNGVCYTDHDTPEPVCHCDYPYQLGAGGDCVEISVCDTEQPCQHGATCERVSPGEYQCHCAAGYTGSLCQHNIDDCDPSPCQNGECQDGIDSYNCTCDSGYEGEHCDQLIDTCPGDCNMTGTESTTPEPDNCRCTCKPGFTGARCDWDIDECLSLPCQHGGICTNSDTPNTFTCNCRDGWTGTDCGELDNYCSPDTCDNDGVCKSLQTDFFCQCASGTFGKTCQTATELCQVLDPCADNGTCQPQAGTATCTCDEGYTGSSCDAIADGCSDDPCENGGRCVSDSVGYTCDCKAPFSGDRCQTKPDPCDTAGCPADSTCEVVDDEALCLCRPGQVKSGDACKETDNNFDLYFTKAEDAIMSQQPFRVNSQALTLALWVAPLDAPTDRPFQLKLSNGTVLLAVGGDSVYFGDLDPVRLTQENDDPADFLPGTWNMFVVTWEASSGAFSMYLRASRLKGGVTSAQFPPEDELLTVHIGAGMTGYISQLYVWNRTLDFSEILEQVYTAPLAVPQAGLVLKWSAYTLNLWTRVLTPSKVQAGLAMCSGGKNGTACDHQSADRTPPEVTDICPEEDVTLETERLTQITDLADPNQLFTDGGPPLSNVNGTLVTFGAHRIVYLSEDDNGNTAVCRFNAYIRRQGQSCNKQDVTDTVVTDCGSSGDLTVSCPADHVPLFSPDKLACGKLGSFNLHDQYRLPAALLCGATDPVKYRAVVTLTFELAIVCGTTTDLETNLKAKIETLRDDWRELCDDSQCQNAEVEASCEGASSKLVTATTTFTDLPAALTNNNVTLTPLELLQTATLEMDAFEINNVANAVLLRDLVVITVTPMCRADYGLLGDACVQCVGGSYLTASGICLMCDVGTFTDAPGAKSCSQCPAGQTTLRPGSTVCKVECSEGNFFNVTSDSCQECPKNFYQHQKGQVTCLPCPAGKVSETTATVSEGECYDTCPAGEQLVDGLCVVCPRGTFRDGVDMEVCEACDEGTTTPGNRSTSHSQCSLPACLPGQMLNSSQLCMDCDYGFFQPDQWQDHCLPCDADHTTENRGSVNESECRFVCPAGREDDGSETCSPCDRGSYRTGSLQDRFAVCTACNASFTTPGTASTSSDDCNIRICEAGNYRNADDNQCYPCQIGYYQPEDLQDECLSCPTNLTTDDEGKKTLQDCIFYCAEGYEVVPDGNETCVACSRGTYKTNLGAAKFGTCQPCTSNTTDDVASVSEDACSVPKCEAGQIVEGDACSDCPEDFYQSIDPPFSTTTCEPCPEGYGTGGRKQTSNDTCIRWCPPGQQTSGDDCVACPQGTYNTGNQTDRFLQCSACHDDLYTTVGTGATHPDNCTLRNCPAGQFINSSDECELCPKGQYQDQPRNTSCKDCPAGTDTRESGSDELADCTISCSAGQEQKQATGACGACDDDYFKAEDGFGQCDQCSGNVTSSVADRTSCSDLFCDVGFTNSGSECAACSIGRYKSERGNTACVSCPANTTTAGEASTSQDDCSVVHCDVGLYAPADAAPCLPCPVGTYKSSQGNQNCTDCPANRTTPDTGSQDVSDCSIIVCPAGQYRDPDNDLNCLVCGVGKYQSEAGQTSCDTCPAGYTTDTDTSDSSSDCKILCDAGYYRAARTDCQPCEVGFYQTEDQSSATACTECTPGYTTEGTNSTSQSDCFHICPAGQYLPGDTQDTCAACPLATYQTQNGTRSCENCPANHTTLQEGSDDELACQPLCAAGEYLNVTERKCVKCSLGQYNPTPATIQNTVQQCENCPDKRTTMFTGATASSSCNITDCGRGQKRTESSGCVDCEKGTYQPQTSQMVCIACPDGETTTLRGRISASSCRELCPDGTAWNPVSQICAECPLHYYRKVNSDTESCIRCPVNQTTSATGSSSCIQDVTGVKPVVRSVTIRVFVLFGVGFCDNKVQMKSVIRKISINILISLDARFAAVCHKDCINVQVVFGVGCLQGSRRRRQTADNSQQQVEVILSDVPEEIQGVLENGREETVKTEDAVLAAFDNHQQEQGLLEENSLEVLNVTNVLISPVCQPGQYTAGDACVDCAAGKYSTDGSVTECPLCPEDKYQNSTGRTSCMDCPDKTYTPGTGTASLADCKRRCDETNARNTYCSGNGDCVYESSADNGVRCECDQKYSGETCNVRESPDDSDKMALIGGIVGGVGAFLLIMLLIFGIVAALRRAARRERKKSRKGEDQMSEAIYPGFDYNYPLYDNGMSGAGRMGRPAIMYMNPAADQDVRDFYQSDRASTRGSRHRSQSYEGAWRDLPSMS